MNAMGRTPKVVAALVGSAGLIVVGRAIRIDNGALAAGGAVVVVVAMTVLALICIHGWVVTTAAARARWHTAADKLESERREYVAFQASVQAERDRVRGELAAGRKALDERGRIERERMQQEFDDARAELMISAFEAGVKAHRDGLLDPPAPGAQVIHLPARAEHPQAATQRPS